MSKNDNKDIRSPIGQEADEHKFSDAEKMRIATGRQGVLSADYYIHLPEYKDMAWRWVHYSTGDVDRALDLGMLMTHKRKDRIAAPKGLHGENTSEWERKAVGSVDGKPEYAYLMHMPKDEYQKYFLQPNIDRNAEIDRAMGLGEISAEDKAVGGGLKTYAGKIGEESHNPIR